jgi:antitoxin component of MazEF toxin-antitoxin module
MVQEIRKIETARKVMPLGKGLSVYLPQEYIKSTGLKGKDLVEMWTDGLKLIVKPAVKEPSLRELFANYIGEYRGEELDWGCDVGGEICD